MTPPMWLAVALSLGQILLGVVLAPAVKAIVNLGTRVALIEHSQSDDRANDTKTSGELHELRNSVDAVRMEVAELKGAVYGRQRPTENHP